ncbi:hypothetical protein QNF13_000589 [Vibrio vulnificus]|nr:hypothetical protein [Vibrio vulnificus]
MRNEQHQFLSPNDDVLAILDGDQIKEAYHKDCKNILFLPFDNIEMEILKRYEDGCDLLPKDIQIDGKKTSKRAKNLVWKLTKTHNNSQLMSMEDLYAYLEIFYDKELKELEGNIKNFLSHTP